MSRASSGAYTLPGGNPVVTGTQITSAWANATLADIAAEITDSLSRSNKGGMLAPLLLADGAVGAPGLSFVTETNSGFYRSASAVISAAIGGVNVMRLSANKHLEVFRSGVWLRVPGQYNQLIALDEGATGDGSTDDTTAFQTMLSTLASAGGGDLIVPKPSSQYKISGTLLVPDGVRILGIGAPGIQTGQCQFLYTGTDAAFALADGEGDTGSGSRNIRFENIGIELTGAGGTGMRLRRCRDIGVYGCATRLTANNQRGFHLMGERSGGSLQGAFDVTFKRVASYAFGAITGVVHYDLSGTDGDGQCNSNSFFGIRAGGPGIGLRVGPSLVNYFAGLEFEALVDHYIQFLSGADHNRIVAPYLGDTGSLVGMIVQCDAGSTNNRVLQILPGTNPTSLIDLGNANSGNIVTYGLKKFVPSTVAAYDEITSPGDAFSLADVRPDGIRYGDGSAAPNKHVGGRNVTDVITDYSSANPAVSISLTSALHHTIRFQTGASGTATIAAPTGIAAGEPAMLHFFNNTAGNITLSWNANYIRTSVLPTLLAANARLTFSGFRSGSQFIIVGTPQVM